MLLSYLPVLIMIGFVSFVGLAALFVSFLFRPSNPYPEKLTAWECGLPPIGEANQGHFRIHFFIIAILFVIFDVETLFLFPWATLFGDKGMLVFLFVEMLIFVVILAAGLIYAWAKGALEWV